MIVFHRTPGLRAARRHLTEREAYRFAIAKAAQGDEVLLYEDDDTLVAHWPDRSWTRVTELRRPSRGSPAGTRPTCRAGQ